MTPDERRNLAEQLKGNPLFDDILTQLERRALDALVAADTEQARIEAQWRVRSVRSFRADCMALLCNTQPRGAIA